MRVGTLVAWMLCVVLSGTAHGNIKPKILIVFDTSGSMLNGGADGSELCSNSNQGCRIYQLKKALFEVLQGMGAEEVDFALSTFPMMVDPGRTPKCNTSCVDAVTGTPAPGTIMWSRRRTRRAPARTTGARSRRTRRPPSRTPPAATRVTPAPRGTAT